MKTKVTVRFVDGFKDGEESFYEEPIPHRIELWPETEDQRQKSYRAPEFNTSRDSQIYDLIEAETPTFQAQKQRG